MEIVRFEEAATFAPRGHDGVLNRALTSRQHGVEQVGVWFGSFEPGAHSDVHVHETSDQVYVVLEGEFLVGDGVTEHRLGRHDTAVIPAGEPHRIRTAERPGSVMVISAPTLR
jgi:mannose-6-phosphate isomerase-like protein (cupin superfamily)